MMISRERKVHLRDAPVSDDGTVFAVAARKSQDRVARPACHLSMQRWGSMEVTTTTSRAKVTCRRTGCR